MDGGGGHADLVLTFLVGEGGQHAVGRFSILTHVEKVQTAMEIIPTVCPISSDPFYVVLCVQEVVTQFI